MPVALVLESDRQNADHLCDILALLDVSAIPAYTERAAKLVLEDVEKEERGQIAILFLGISGSKREPFEQPGITQRLFPGKDIPVVLVAPAGCKNLVEKVEQIGARAIITKPVTLESVASVLVGMNFIRSD